MRKQSLARLTVYASVVVLLGLVGNVAAGLISVPESGKPWVLTAAALLAVGAILIDVRRNRDVSREGGPSAVGDIVGMLNSFAKTVVSQWGQEEVIRRIHDPVPIPVDWELAPSRLTDHWANIRRLPSGASARPLDLGGSLARIVNVYRRIPSGRLVVLGRAGSGKTILAIRFVIESIRRRRPDDAVPVIFRLSSWDPVSELLRDWLIRQLVEDYPALMTFIPSRGVTLAATLVDDGYILPVLDGLDEVACGLQPDAIRAINATSFPLVMTSRLEEYGLAVEQADVVTAAAVVCLTDLTVADLHAYLPRTARVIDSANGKSATKWNPVLGKLRQADALRSVLTTPLMVSLARAIYSDNPIADPVELLDVNRFSSRQAIEDHLLDSYMRELYSGPKNARWGADDAERWLGYLAIHLRSLDTQELAWWELRNGLKKHVRLVVFGLLGAFGTALFLYPVWWFGAGFGLGFATIPALWRHGRKPIRSPLRLRGRGLRTFFVLVVCALAGFVGALVGSRIGVFTGAVVLNAFIGRSSALDLDSPWGFVVGLVSGLTLAAASSFDLAGTKNVPQPRGTGKIIFRGVILAFLGAVIGSVALGEAGGMALGLTAGPMAALVADFETVVDVKVATNPRRSLIVDSRNLKVERFLLGSCFGFSVFISGAQYADLVTSAALGLGSALATGVGNGMVGTASGQWAIARTYLAVTGRVPFRLMQFLDDAHERGVLRQAGAVFQFRHVRLQERLAETTMSVKSSVVTSIREEG